MDCQRAGGVGAGHGKNWGCEIRAYAHGNDSRDINLLWQYAGCFLTMGLTASVDLPGVHGRGFRTRRTLLARALETIPSDA